MQHSVCTERESEREGATPRLPPGIREMTDEQRVQRGAKTRLGARMRRGTRHIKPYDARGAPKQRE